MKKYLIIAGLLVLPLFSEAASFIVAPSSGNYEVNDIITLNLSVDPAGDTIYTAMLDASFSPSTFEVVSFTMNDSMLAMKQPGYDSLNNSSGAIIKTGGYAGGMNSSTSFGRLTLRAKEAGTASFTINSTSKLLDSNNANKNSGAKSVSFTIATKPAVSENTQTTNPPSQTTEPVAKKPAQASSKQSNDVVAQTESGSPATTTQVAAVSGSNVSRNIMLWIGGILLLTLSYIGGYISAKRKIFTF